MSALFVAPACPNHSLSWSFSAAKTLDTHLRDFEVATEAITYMSEVHRSARKVRHALKDFYALFHANLNYLLIQTYQSGISCTCGKFVDCGADLWKDQTQQEYALGELRKLIDSERLENLASVNSWSWVLRLCGFLECIQCATEPKSPGPDLETTRTKGTRV